MREGKILNLARHKQTCKWSWNTCFAKLMLSMELWAHPHLYPHGGQKPRLVGKKHDLKAGEDKQTVSKFQKFVVNKKKKLKFW